MILQYKSRREKIEDVLSEKLPAFFSDKWRHSFFGDIPPVIADHFFSTLISPCRDLMLLGGKRWRPLFQVLCSELVSNAEPSYELVPLVEFVHTASLIHDDIEDGSDTRRGEPAAYIKFGMDVAINSGSWLYFAAAECIQNSNFSSEEKNILYGIFFTELRRLHAGQAMDIYWHRNKSVIPSEEEYLAMTSMKTGTLSCLAAKTGVISGHGTEDDVIFMGKVASSIGIGFQILDDVINLTTGNKGKKRGDDIVEGKKSLPLILHLKNKPDDLDRILSCFERAEKEGINSSAVEECIEILSSSNAVSVAYERSRTLILDSCRKIASKYPDSQAAVLIGELFANMVREFEGIR
ncbi:MAG: polyprenyl synthetase family protein [Treponemataceae bacterium]|nr:polyprenyl synthetase family protein [Treponemataceae bacterium]